MCLCEIESVCECTLFIALHVCISVRQLTMEEQANAKQTLRFIFGSGTVTKSFMQISKSLFNFMLLIVSTCNPLSTKLFFTLPPFRLDHTDW